MPDELQDITEAHEVRIVRVQPGDTIVLRYPGYLSPQGAANLTRYAEARFKCPVIVLVEGIEIDVLRKEGQ